MLYRTDNSQAVTRAKQKALNREQSLHYSKHRIVNPSLEIFYTGIIGMQTQEITIPNGN